MVTKKEKDEAIVHRMKNRMYELAMSGKCQNWQDVKDHLLSEGYSRKMINDDVGITFRRDEMDYICKKYYKNT